MKINDLQKKTSQTTPARVSLPGVAAADRHTVRQQPPVIQASYTVFEQEADRIAEQAIRMPEPWLQSHAEPEKKATIQIKPIANQIASVVQKQDEKEEEEEPIQAKLADRTHVQRQDVVPEEEPIHANHLDERTPRTGNIQHSLRDGGQPSPESMQNLFEPYTGHDFSRGRVPANGKTVREMAERGVGVGEASLPHLAEIQRSFGRHDIRHVRAHLNSQAVTAARAIGARAYTTGDHVVFAGAPDLLTAAHEAAHVVQQRAGVQLSDNVGQVGDPYERHADAVAEHVVGGRSAETLLDQMAPAGSRSFGVQRQVVQRAPIPTDFGNFDMTKYDKVGPAGSEYGVDIVLTFDPDRTKANAKKIGLTQSVRSQLAGTNVVLFPVQQGRMVTSGTGEGSQIDRYGGGNYGNPLYATGVPGAKDKLGDTATVASWGQHGWNYKDDSGKPQHQIAILKDRPTLPDRGNNSSQIFETAALAVEGVQVGTYMGSVSWGWSVDGTGKFTQQPLTIKSKGKPSSEFIAAAKQWNKTSVGGTVKATADPTNVYDASYSVAFTVAKGTEVQVTDAAPIHNNITYDEVTILSGTKTGSTGRIKVNDMKETGGKPVINLPIP